MSSASSTVWTRVRLELARSHEFPDGSTRHGYLLVLPLDKNLRIDDELYRSAPELASVHRFWEGEGDAVGRLVRRGPSGWAFAYHADRADDEPVPHLSEHDFRIGDYLAVREANGREHVLRIVSLMPVPGLAHARGVHH